ncbi:hypothetical protein EDC19_0659 [Natranaerovirga hydrolytica]|uniref:Flavoprotein n=1 Tax=Natranaerovirga hydrolytica TaxID=680378 RepID=A0A4R1N5I1_9FIRM|nr:NAD(P)/FAD-dependent oxidoreductase [Natranaerovirga hydrolytica]TCK98239.1 hypothetical protein EDC19_0659 [Natranaerovirga hydrolytica]
MGKNTVTVIGGGASGLVASIICARAGAKVTLIERMNQLGKKILATGNGKCNLTNTNLTPNHYNGNQPKFVISTLNQFNVEDTLNFFKDLGIYPRIDNGYVYPYSNQASAVLEVLQYEVDRLKVKVIYEEEVNSVTKNNNQFMIHTNKSKYYAHKVILSTGGQSYPNLGSNGSGYKIAEQLGHTLVKPYPGLVQLKAKADYFKRIKGVRVNGSLSLYNDNRLVKKEYGEILFTDYGLSGIATLQISRFIKENIKDNKIKVCLDLMPELEEDVLDQLLIQRFEQMPYKTIEQSLVGLINNKLIPIIIKESKGNPNEKVSQLSKNIRHNLVKQLKEWIVYITGTNNWDQSQVTVGGISTDEIHPNTLESKLIEHLYFTGEVMDIDGDCGGYNLQWAWSTGYIAGLSATNKN